MRRNKVIRVVVFLILVAAAFMAYKVLPLQTARSAEVYSDNMNEGLGVPIDAAEAVKGKLEEKITYVGTIYPRDTVQVLAAIPAEITEIYVKEGNYVAQGQTIAKLDDESIVAKLDTLQAKIDTIEYNLSYMRDEAEKQRVLYEGSAVPKAAYDKIVHETGMIEMQVKELYAQKAEIEVSLKNTVITAPMSGVVREVGCNPGDFAVAGKPVAIIDDLSRLTVKVNISESDLSKIKKGTPVLLTAAGVENKIPAKVTKVLPDINPQTRIGEVEIDAGKPQKGTQIILGTSVRTEFVTKVSEDGYMVPQGAIKQLTSGPVLYKLEGGFVQEVPIETGISSNSQVQVTEGLKESDKVAVSNIDKLYDGAKVYVFEGNDL